MKKIFHYFILALLLSGIKSTLFAQNFQLKEPPTQENTYLFEILDYNRQPKLPEYMIEGIENMVEKPMTKWTAKDSLFYAYENVHLQNFELAFNIFSRLNTDTIAEKHGQILYRITLQRNKRFNRLEKFNQHTFEDESDKIYDVKRAYADLIIAFKAYEKETFIEDSTLIFPILKSDELKKVNRNAPPNKNKLVTISFAIDSLMRQVTILNDKNDFIISKAFEEMGDFQKKNLYLTNAYFYYAASLHYNKNNQSVFAKYNKVINEMSTRNYISISFKTKFGLVIKNRYKLRKDYLKEEVKDTTFQNKNHTLAEQKKKDYLPWLDTPILIMILLGLILIYILLFIKTKE